MNDSNKQELLASLLKLAEKEQKSGNTAITQEKLNKLSTYVINHKSPSSSSYLEYNKFSSYYPPPPQSSNEQITHNNYSPLFNKFKLTSPQTKTPRKLTKPSRFKVFERNLISFLEIIANILDNLHLFSKMPMFPQQLMGLLKQTNKLWIVLLLFLIRKTVSQLLNLLKKEAKVKTELSILSNNQSKVLDNSMVKKYEKILKDLKFDKLMLYLELFGNALDLLFNSIEVYGFPVPDWFMSGLNMASMFMTIYRMNKDDEYVDDDITDELI